MIDFWFESFVTLNGVAEHAQHCRASLKTKLSAIVFLAACRTSLYSRYPSECREINRAIVKKRQLQQANSQRSRAVLVDYRHAHVVSTARLLIT